MISKTTDKQHISTIGPVQRLQAPFPSHPLGHVEPRLDLAVFVIELRISLYPHFPEALPLYPLCPELLQLFANVVAVAHHVIDLEDGIGGNVASRYLNQSREPRNDVKIGKRLAWKGEQQANLVKAYTYDLISKGVRADDCLLQSVDDLRKTMRPCLLTGFEESLLSLLSGLSSVNRVQDVVGLLLFLQELNGTSFQR